jgi:hypothetical protein
MHVCWRAPLLLSFPYYDGPWRHLQEHFLLARSRPVLPVVGTDATRTQIKNVVFNYMYIRMKRICCKVQAFVNESTGRL